MVPPTVLCYRPKWNSSITAEQLDVLERDSFIAWRRGLAKYVHMHIHPIDWGGVAPREWGGVAPRELGR